MDIQDTSSAVYSEAKSEYTKQLVYNFQPVLLRFFLDRYNEAKGAQAVVSKSKSSLSEFQESLSQIPEWNLDKVQRETATLLQGVHCDYIEDLITAVFIAHTKILSAIRLHAKPRRKIQITVPKPDHFMHRTLSECSRLLWSNIYLFNDSVSSLDRQKHMNDVNRFLEEGILQAIRNLLPVKSILRDSLQDDEDDSVQIQSGDKESEAPASEPPASEPAASEPSASEPPASEPAASEPAASEPAASEPAASEPAASEPAAPEPPASEPPALEAAMKIPSLDPKSKPSVVEQIPVNTFVVDTEKSVGFTGIDSVFGTSGDAELRPMVEEGADDLQIIGESEDINLGDFEDLNAAPMTPAPLGADDYESI